jgi:acetolactate synthase I/II/III large subunit
MEKNKTIIDKIEKHKKLDEPVRVTGAEAVIMSLLEEKVTTIFGYPGGAIMPIYDHLMNYDKRMNHILVRHEQGGAHAAQAYSMVTGKEGVCFATSGPGATNLITGITNAHMDSVPMVFVTAQVPSSLLGSDAFQETDVVGLSMPVTKWNYQITKAEEIPDAFAKAFYIANTGRKGPVLLDITKDAQMNELDFVYKKYPAIRSYKPYPELNYSQIEKAAEAINQAKKPLILAGHGVLLSKADAELRQLAEKAGIPVASTLLGLSAFPEDSPLFVGMLGMHGNYGPNIKTNDADLVISVGMRFDDRVTGNLSKYAKDAKIIHIEIDAAEIDKIVPTLMPVNSDAKSALNALLDMVKDNSHDEWLEEFRKCEKIEYDKVISKDVNPKNGNIRMGEVVNKVSELTNGKAIIASDVGQNQMAVARYYKFKEPNTNVTSGGLGTMGFGLPAAIGAQFGRPDKPVVMFAGDGGFQMNIQELGTIMQHELPVKMIIFNNNFLGMVRQWQDMFFDKRYASTDMPTPDFIMIAKGYGIAGEVISERNDIDAALKRMMEHEGPYLLEFKIEKEANIMPMITPGASVSEILL